MPFDPSNSTDTLSFRGFFCPFSFYEHLTVNFSPSHSDISLISSLHHSMCLLVLFLSFISVHNHPKLTPFHAFSPTHLYLLLSLCCFVAFLLVCLELVSQAIMETNQQLHHHHQNQQQANDQDNSGGAKGSFLCRQSSTRWTPTSDQIRILKDLYYNNGVRSPTAEQIQRISARLRQYGKIEGKNVFYWFQNHKARERQKKRFNNDASMQQRTLGNASANWKPPEDYSFHNKCSNISPGFASSCSSSAGMVNVGPMGNCGFGSVTMEKSFKDCSISAGANCGAGHSDGSWVGINTYGYTLFDKRKSTSEALEEYGGEEEDEATPDIETLPLFPVHRENINAFCNIRHNPNFYYSNWYADDDGTAGPRSTSLELSLKSYTGQASDSI